MNANPDTNLPAHQLTKRMAYLRICYVLTGLPTQVFTNLLLDDSTPELRKFPFGVLAAQPEEVG